MKRLLATLIASALVWACSDNASETAGATSETTNGIAFRVVDAERAPLALARVSLYSKADMVKLDSAVTDSEGVAVLASPAEECFLEGIAGKDSALMAFEPFDTAAAEVALLPSASVVVRVGDLDSAVLEKMRGMYLMQTPYAADFRDGTLLFAHVPAGMFSVALGDSVVAENVKVDAGGTLNLDMDVAGNSAADTTVAADTSAVADTTAAVDTTARDTSVALDTNALDTASLDTNALDTTAQVARPVSLFEDFDDGDSLNYFAEKHPNYGWYFNELSGAKFTRPDSLASFAAALDSSDERGYYLSTKYDLGDSGMVLIGTHVGEDSAFYDFSTLEEIRITLRGDGDVMVALEYHEEVVENQFNKALWSVKATGEWTEFVLKPGEEIILPEAYEVEFGSISNGIALFSIFASSGTYLEVDKIELVGWTGE